MDTNMDLSDLMEMEGVSKPTINHLMGKLFGCKIDVPNQIQFNDGLIHYIFALRKWNLNFKLLNY